MFGWFKKYETTIKIPSDKIWKYGESIVGHVCVEGKKNVKDINLSIGLEWSGGYDWVYGFFNDLDLLLPKSDLEQISSLGKGEERILDFELALDDYFTKDNITRYINVMNNNPNIESIDYKEMWDEFESTYRNIVVKEGDKVKTITRVKTGSIDFRSM